MIKLPHPLWDLGDNEQKQNWFMLLWRRVTVDLNNKEWTTWTPTVSNDASMTIGSVSITSAQYAVFGQVVFFNFELTFTTGGSADSDVSVTLPLTTANAVSFGGFVIDGGSEIGGIAISTAGSATIKVKRYDSANWGLGASRKISLSGCYKSTQAY